VRGEVVRFGAGSQCELSEILSPMRQMGLNLSSNGYLGERLKIIDGNS